MACGLEFPEFPSKCRIGNAKVVDCVLPGFCESERVDHCKFFGEDDDDAGTPTRARVSAEAHPQRAMTGQSCAEL